MADDDAQNQAETFSDPEIGQCAACGAPTQSATDAVCLACAEIIAGAEEEPIVEDDGDEEPIAGPRDVDLNDGDDYPRPEDEGDDNDESLEERTPLKEPNGLDWPDGY